MNISIIRAELEHLDDLVPLFNAYREFYRQEADLEGAHRFLYERIANQESIIFLALATDTEPHVAAGFTQLYPSFTSTGMKRIWILNDLYVVPEFRRQGVARQLMEAARELALGTAAARVTLATAQDNLTAKALYESLGYRLDTMFDHYNLVL